MAKPLALIWDLIATDNATAVFERVGASAEHAAAKTSGFESAFKAMGGIVAVAAVGIAVVATKMAVDFQESTAVIQGSAQISADAASAIGDAFLGTAGKSTFSGKAMSDAFGPVAGVVQQLAGHTLTAADSLAVMTAATTLAEATGGDLTATTSNLTDVMLNFGIGVDGASEAANTLYNTSRLTNIPLDTLTTTVDKLHGKLGIAAPDLTQVGGLLADLAAHGISGSKGVMVANSAMQTLLGGSKATGDELKALGVHVFDSSGKFVGMQAVLEQLTPKLAGMSDKARIAAETALFGKGAQGAMNATIMAGADAFNAATTAVTAHNAVETAAEAKASTLAGQMKKLKATLADYMVQLGEKIIPVVQKTVDWMSKHQFAVELLAGVIGGVLLAATIAWAAATIVATWPILLTIAAVAALAAGILWLGNNFDMVRAALVYGWDLIKVGANEMALVIVKAFAWVADMWLTTVSNLIDGAAKAFGWVPGLGPKLQEAAKTFGAFKDTANGQLDKIKKDLQVNIDTGLAQAAIDRLKINAAQPIQIPVVLTGTAAATYSAIRLQTQFPGHAAGTDSSPGGWHWAGENGRELINFNPGAKVLNHAQSEALANAPAGPVDLSADTIDQLAAAILAGAREVSTSTVASAASTATRDASGRRTTGGWK